MSRTIEIFSSKVQQKQNDKSQNELDIFPIFKNYGCILQETKENINLFLEQQGSYEDCSEEEERKPHHHAHVHLEEESPTKKTHHSKIKCLDFKFYQPREKDQTKKQEFTKKLQRFLRQSRDYLAQIQNRSHYKTKWTDQMLNDRYIHLKRKLQILKNLNYRKVKVFKESQYIIGKQLLEKEIQKLEKLQPSRELNKEDRQQSIKKITKFIQQEKNTQRKLKYNQRRRLLRRFEVQLRQKLKEKHTQKQTGKQLLNKLKIALKLKKNQDKQILRSLFDEVKSKVYLLDEMNKKQKQPEIKSNELIEIEDDSRVIKESLLKVSEDESQVTKIIQIQKINGSFTMDFKLIKLLNLTFDKIRSQQSQNMDDTIWMTMIVYQWLLQQPDQQDFQYTFSLIKEYLESQNTQFEDYQDQIKLILA